MIARQSIPPHRTAAVELHSEVSLETWLEGRQ